jgi:hypothetical protein
MLEHFRALLEAVRSGNGFLVLIILGEQRLVLLDVVQRRVCVLTFVT